jgi:hypothetical protein
MRTRIRRAVFVCAVLAVVGVVTVGALVAIGRPTGQVVCGPRAGTASCTRVLFIGNSYTYANDLPGTFAELARAAGHEVETGMLATGGATLADHAADVATMQRLGSSRWDHVVLQEQSQIPAIRGLRGQQMYPAARSLVVDVRATGARPLLLVTWAHRDGWPENGLPDFAAMQDGIDAGYESIARELAVPEAPVGYVWAQVRRDHPEVDLWQADGSHPSVSGTYLAACVLYASIFRESPPASSSPAGLSQATAALLRQSAAALVLADPAAWGLR